MPLSLQVTSGWLAPGAAFSFVPHWRWRPKAPFFQAGVLNGQCLSKPLKHGRCWAGVWLFVSWVHSVLLMFCVPKCFWPPSIGGSCQAVRAGVAHHDSSLLSCTAAQPHAQMHLRCPGHSISPHSPSNHSLSLKQSEASVSSAALPCSASLTVHDAPGSVWLFDN